MLSKTSKIKALSLASSLCLLSCKTQAPPVVSSDAAGASGSSGLTLSNTSPRFYDVSCNETHSLKMSKDGFKANLLFELTGGGSKSTHSFGFYYSSETQSDDFSAISISESPDAVVFDPSNIQANTTHSYNFIARNKAICLKNLEITTFKDSHPNINCDLKGEFVNEIFGEFDHITKVYFTVLPNEEIEKAGLFKNIFGILTGLKKGENAAPRCLNGLKNKGP